MSLVNNIRQNRFWFWGFRLGIWTLACQKLEIIVWVLAGCMCCFDPVVVCENPLVESGVYDVLPKSGIFVIIWDIMGHKSEELYLPRRLAQN